MNQGTVVSIGTFDGIHLGHQAILNELRRQSEMKRLSSLVYAFTVPPRWALQGREERYLLLPESVRFDLLRREANGIQPADLGTIRRMSPREFVESVLIEQLHARIIVEGASFRFGQDRVGSVATLQALGKETGLEIISVPSVIIDNQAVSSTRIRAAIEAGDLQTAHRCLGRSPVLFANILRGERPDNIMPFPATHLSVDSHVLLPPSGSYLVYVLGNRLQASGLLTLSTRPMLNQATLRCEVHLLDTSEVPFDDETLEIHLLRTIREHRAIASRAALRMQIRADMDVARSLLIDYPIIEKPIRS